MWLLLVWNKIEFFILLLGLFQERKKRIANVHVHREQQLRIGVLGTTGMVALLGKAFK